MGGNLFKSSSRFPRECLVPTVKAFKKALGLPDEILGEVTLENNQLAGSKHKKHLGDIDIVVDSKEFYKWLVPDTEETLSDALFYDKEKVDLIKEKLTEKMPMFLKKMHGILGHNHVYKNFITQFANFEIKLFEDDKQKYFNNFNLKKESKLKNISQNFSFDSIINVIKNECIGNSIEDKVNYFFIELQSFLNPDEETIILNQNLNNFFKTNFTIEEKSKDKKGNEITKTKNIIGFTEGNFGSIFRGYLSSEQEIKNLMEILNHAKEIENKTNEFSLKKETELLLKKNGIIIDFKALPSLGCISFIFPIFPPPDKKDFWINHINELDIKLKNEIFADVFDEEKLSALSASESEDFKKPVKIEEIEKILISNPIHTQIDILLGNLEWSKKMKSGLPFKIENEKVFPREDVHSNPHKPALRFILLKSILSCFSEKDKKKLFKSFLFENKKIPDTVPEKDKKYVDLFLKTEKSTQGEKFENEKNDNKIEIILNEGEIYEDLNILKDGNPIKCNLYTQLDAAIGFLLVYDVFLTNKKGTGFLGTPQFKKKIILTSNIDEFLKKLSLNWEDVEIFEKFWGDFKEKKIFKDINDTKRKEIIKKFLDSVSDEGFKLKEWWIDENLDLLKQLPGVVGSEYLELDLKKGKLKDIIEESISIYFKDISKLITSKKINSLIESIKREKINKFKKIYNLFKISN